jgi:RNA-binding motif X-linked protein 2
MNKTRQIERLNKIEQERRLGGSWHDEFSDTSWVYARVPVALTEGDLLAVFEQYGSIIDLVLVRDKEGESRGFAYLCYEDQRSTILCVDNLNGFVIQGFTLTVDHTRYRHKDPKEALARMKQLAAI